jgi:hypothetical protein
MCSQDLSATDPAALGLRHSLHAQSSACIEKVDSVGIMQLPSHPDPVGKLQDAGCKESELPENPSQEGLEPLELARRESQRAHACTLEEKGLPTSALLTTRKPLETQEQQETQGELEILGAMPSAPANEVVHKEPELQAEAEVVSYTKAWREPVLEKAALVLLQGGTVEEQSQALVSSERSPGRLSKDCWTHEKAVIQHAPAEPDVSDEPTRLLARSERSISPSPEQSESNLQNLKSRADTLPVLAIDRTPIAPSALSSQLGLRLDTKITAGQAFAKQDVNVPAKSRSAKPCPLPTAALEECARRTLEQNSLPETETGGLPAPPALNRSVRDLEVVPDREVQVRIANSMHTIDGEQTAPITRDSLTPKPPNCGEADQDSASRRYKNGCRTVNHPISPVIDGVDIFPTSPCRGPRSTLERADQFSDELAVALRPLLEPSAAASCSGSPIYQKRLHSMELAPQHIQPLVDYRRYSGRWTTRPHESPQGDIQLLQHRHACAMSPSHSNTTLFSELHIPMRRTDWSSAERAVATRPMQCAVLVEPRRKKPLMKRAKTECGTCRRRKEKCDEAKPECNNCTRIGIICQGYMDKMMLRKNEISTSLPSLSDPTRMHMDAHQPESRPRRYDLAYILNGEPGLGSSQSIHEDTHAPVQSADTVDGGVTVEERRFPSPASSGGTGRHDLSHVSCLREQSYPPAHHPRSPLAPVPVYERDVSNKDCRVMHPIQILPSLYHNPRIHDQTAQSVVRGTANPSAAASEAHQQRAQSPRVSLPAILTAAPPKPSRSWRKQAPSLPKTEKQKMLDEEPFMPYSTQLVDDRRQCAAVLIHGHYRVE